MTSAEYASCVREIDTPHGRFAYADTGEGPPVLFVHGLLISGFMWHRVIEEVRGERRCIAYHLPHHGGSTVPDDQPLTLEAHAEMLDGFCEALGLDGIDVVANDTGGAIAQALAVGFPGRVRSLVLTNCEANDWLPSKDELAVMVEALARQGQLAPALKAGHDDPAGARQGPFALTYQWPDRISDDEIAGLQRPHQATLEGARKLEQAVVALDSEQLVALEPALRQLTVPTLLVWGTGDQIFPLHLAEWLRDTIPGCQELVEVPDGKLFWPFERGGELTPHLRRFWSAIAAGDGAAVT